MEPLMRDFTSLKSQLLSRETELRARMDRLKHDERRTDGALPADFEEQATELENEEVRTALSDSGRVELVQIRAALDRMDAGDFGECVNCGEPIADARLQAVPFALRCLSCATESGRS